MARKKCKMMLQYILYVSSIITLASAGSYQYFRYVRPNGRGASTKTNWNSKFGSSRNSRSFSYPVGIFDESENFLPNGAFIPQTNLIDVTQMPDELTQFSFDLNDYHDPLLLTGNAARAAVAIIYGKGELFFSDYPHVRALLKNQDKRRKNGLSGNKLGSLRLSSPFIRLDEKYFSPY